MSSIQKICNLSKNLAQKIQLPSRLEGIDTSHELVRLGMSPNWQNEDFLLVDFFAKKIDTNGRLYHGYSAKGSVTNDEIIETSEILELAFVILFRVYLEESEAGSMSEVQLKRLNSLYKASDLVLSPTSDIVKLQDQLDDFLKIEVGRLTVKKRSCQITSPTIVLDSPKTMLKLPITVLFYEGPIARAYLETIRQLGFEPEKIIQLISGRDLSNGKPVGRWLPNVLRKNYASSVQKTKIHFWPKKLAISHKALVQSVKDNVESQFGFSADVQNEANTHHDLKHYCGNVETILIESLKDKALFELLNGMRSTSFLFTGGGVVPTNLLNITQHKFIHIHPGFLPNIRGADCMLWSSLLGGHFSATCFYMVPGIDMGDVIVPCWLPSLQISATNERVDTLSLYRVLFGFLDPWIRSFVLREFILRFAPFENIKFYSQHKDDGTTFHFMHRKFQEAAMNAILS